MRKPKPKHTARIVVPDRTSRHDRVDVKVAGKKIGCSSQRDAANLCSLLAQTGVVDRVIRVPA